MVEKEPSKPKNIGTLTTENNKYQLIRLLGEGTTSRVYLSKNLTDEKVVAIKIFKT